MRVPLLFKRLALGFALASPLFAGAQEVQTKVDDMYFPFTPDGLPMGAPAWMAELSKPDQVNFNQMIKRYSAYLDATPEARIKTPRAKAVVNYFQRWRRTVEPYVQADGSIRMPSMSLYREQIKDMTKESDLRTFAGSSVEGWKLLSPIVTYDVEHKRMTPAQANVQRLDVAPSNPNILFAGTETGMIFKSIDKGEHWTPCRPMDYFGGEISTIEISETNPDKVLVGAGATLWLTSDGGETWRNITPSGIRGYRRVRDAVLKRDNDRHILMGNDNGLYLSEDDGQTWTLVQIGQTFDIKYKRNDSQTVYAMVRSGAQNSVAFMRSRNAGRTFETINIGEKKLNSARIGLSDAPNGADYIYIWGCELTWSYNQHFYNGPALLYKSTDAGNSWTENAVSAQLEPHDRNGGQGYYDMVVAASPIDPEVVLVGLLHLYRSNDGGRTFVNRGGYYGNAAHGNFDLHCDMQDLSIIGGDTWLSTDGGIIYSSDFFDKKAEAKIRGIYASEMWGFDQGWNEDVMVGGRNHNGNMSHLASHGGVTISMRGSEVSTGYVFLSNPRRVGYSDTGDVVVIPDNWQNEYVPFYRYWQYYPSESTHYGMGFEYDPRDARRFLIIRGNDDESKRKLWRTTDDGESFTELYAFDAAITSYVISRANPDKIVVATKKGIYQSLDDGRTFEPINILPEMSESIIAYKIALHPTRADEIWISTDEPGGIYRTTDNGTTWTKLSKGLLATNPTFPNEMYKITRFFLTGNEENAVYAIASVLRPKDDYYSTLRGRVLYWDDNTDGWVDYSAGLPSVMTLNRMLPFYKDGKIRLATNNGVWERPLRRSKFRPIAQPMIISEEPLGAGRKRVKLESYSIVNQEGAKWSWSFRPEPLKVTGRDERNPIIEVDADQTYDITLMVQTPDGEHARTVEAMLKGSKPVPLSVARPEYGVRDLTAVPSSLRVGEVVRFTSIGLEEAVLVHIFAVDGREVTRFSLAPGAEYTFSTEGLSAGTYFYSVPQGVIHKVGRFVIQ